MISGQMMMMMMMMMMEEEAIIVTWGLVTSYSLLIKPNLPCILT